MSIARTNRLALGTGIRGLFPPGQYQMSYYWDKKGDSHDRFRLEPYPNDTGSRILRDLKHPRFHGLGSQLHRGHFSLGCINAILEDPGAMMQYDMLLHLLLSEEGHNFLSVVE